MIRSLCILILSCLLYSNYQAQIDFGALLVETQDLRGSIVPDVNIELYTNDSVLVANLQTDSSGLLKIHNLADGIYYSKASSTNYTTNLYPHILISSAKITFITLKMELVEETAIKIQASLICKYHRGKVKPKCQICQSKKGVIPYVYGYPSERMFYLNAKGKVFLGGCMVQKCQPSWYCKKDKVAVEEK